MACAALQRAFPRFDDDLAWWTAAAKVLRAVYMMSLIELFWICRWLSIAMIGLAWLSSRPATHDGPSAADQGR